MKYPTIICVSAGLSYDTVLYKLLFMHLYNLGRGHFHIPTIYLTDNTQLPRKGTRPVTESSSNATGVPLSPPSQMLLHDRNLSQQRNIHLCSQLLCAFFSEDIVFIFGKLAGVNQAIFSTKPRIGTFTLSLVNILIPYGHLPKPLPAGTDNNRSCHSQCLNNGQMNITGSGRKVYQKIIQISPSRITYQLFLTALLAIPPRHKVA